MASKIQMFCEHIARGCIEGQALDGIIGRIGCRDDGDGEDEPSVAVAPCGDGSDEACIKSVHEIRGKYR